MATNHSTKKHKDEKVIVSYRVVDFPCCLVIEEYEWTANMENLVKAECIFSTKINLEKSMEVRSTSIRGHIWKVLTGLR